MAAGCGRRCARARRIWRVQLPWSDQQVQRRRSGLLTSSNPQEVERLHIKATVFRLECKQKYAVQVCSRHSFPPRGGFDNDHFVPFDTVWLCSFRYTDKIPCFRVGGSGRDAPDQSQMNSVVHLAHAYFRSALRSEEGGPCPLIGWIEALQGQFRERDVHGRAEHAGGGQEGQAFARPGMPQHQ